MPENIYLNYLSDSKLPSADEDESHCSERIQRLFSVLLFLSLLANGGLAYLYHTKNANQHCEPKRNYFNSGSHVDSQPIMKTNSMNIKNHSIPNYCSDADIKEKWVQDKGRFYVFSTDTMDWNSSRERCQDLGGDLVIINSMEEQEFLSERVIDYHWIGLTDSQTEGVWLWVDNTPLNNNLLWESPPDDWKVENPLHGEDCVILKGEKWGDVSCLRKEKRICQIPCSPSPQ
ncbi:C-type lectin domain family 4 member E-like isoform X1 [Megalobrama amblycephala]|uniref:C-type lectin domain family 4 member E-like isoform X1 n=2 Tax=Megalobrama amblycephala TaxID=75352 RepID=UPI0020144204|nr:C-type lectin domain family 4 member E-like isoform X1 [Megalobrama amblycephala]